MKNLLLILLFLPVIGMAQIAITNQTAISVSTADGTNRNISSAILQSNSVYLFIVTNSKASSPDIPTATSPSFTWTQVATETTATHRVTVFRALVVSGATETITATFGATYTGVSLQLIRVTGCVLTGTNGSDAIVQSVTDVGAGADPAITMAAISSSRNSVMAFFANNINPFGSTEEAGWTLLGNTGYDTPASGITTTMRLNTTDNTPTVTAASSDWAGIAIEIKSTARRRINID